MTWVVVRKVFISSSIDRPLANNFLDIRQISEKSGYLSLMMMICWWANFSDKKRQSFRQIILCPPHCGIRGNSRLSHGVAVTWRPMIFRFSGRRYYQTGNASVTAVEKRTDFLSPGPLYVGLASISLENRKDMGSVYERVAFNMQGIDIPGTLHNQFHRFPLSP